MFLDQSLLKGQLPSKMLVPNAFLKLHVKQGYFHFCQINDPHREAGYTHIPEIASFGVHGKLRAIRTLFTLLRQKIKTVSFQYILQRFELIGCSVYCRMYKAEENTASSVRRMQLYKRF